MFDKEMMTYLLVPSFLGHRVLPEGRIKTSRVGAGLVPAFFLVPALLILPLGTTPAKRGSTFLFWIIALFLLLTSVAHAAVEVIPADAPTIKRAIAARKGHVVMVNFWATWCGPCVAEFPAVIQASRRYKAQGLATLTVTADAEKDLNTKVLPFLLKSGASFPVYLERSADPQDFITAFDSSWQGDLPRTFIYNRQGKLVRILSGPQTSKSLAAAIRPYLKHRHSLLK